MLVELDDAGITEDPEKLFPEPEEAGTPEISANDSGKDSAFANCTRNTKNKNVPANATIATEAEYKLVILF